MDEQPGDHLLSPDSYLLVQKLIFHYKTEIFPEPFLTRNDWFVMDLKPFILIKETCFSGILYASPNRRDMLTKTVAE